MSAIGVGDLVAVVRTTPCCGDPTDIGALFTVKRLNRGTRGQCTNCGAVISGDFAAEVSTSMGLPLSMLQKIHPLGHPQHVETPQEELCPF